MGIRQHVWGRYSLMGLVVALVTFALDQASKTWVIHGLHLPDKERVGVLPFLDLVMAWNVGISYGLFQQDSMAGQYLLAAFKVVVALAMIWWLAHTLTKVGAWALGMLIGGALGNALDRLVYGAVADFFSLHFAGYYWYVFNLADVGIVAGVGLLLYESFLPQSGGDAGEAPQKGP